VQQAIGAARRDRAILDVFADDSGAFLIAATEQVAAIVVMPSCVCVLVVVAIVTVFMLMIVCHDLIMSPWSTWR